MGAGARVQVVASDRGVLVRSTRTEPMRLGTAHFVDVDDLERKIGRVLGMNPEERCAIGQSARKWYEAKCADFEYRMKKFLSEI